MNIILFESQEVGRPLSRRDERTIHLVKVLHKKTGDIFDAGILNGSLGTGHIDSIGIDGSLRYSLDLRDDPPPRNPIRIGVGFPRPIQLRRLLRDLSNLGVQSIDLLGTDLGEKSYRDTKLLNDGGARAALIEGAVQARDTRLPDVRSFRTLDTWLEEQPWEKEYAEKNTNLPLHGSPLLIAPDNVRPEGSMTHLGSSKRPVVLAVGSERGWSDRERDLLEHSGFIRLSMGSRALKTETACIAAVILALEKTGGLG
ncbi:16S rRNA (uracil(1498)-N(3))-methyltransferase [Breznakiella homolactica]|uniref:Ribosomal RNA small subunit methyltransferase E n=1 Tax=Breznakiella homolactica TaxID=2798577 RepID=A0A7T7XN53_9SPIR|nr:RsmE family RNA methyltransferase [Breznakiella homolactica]QQO09415.1 16S rRNA (uracil(1498)-N(3))-methyltransferase [Breznakiella homolactica]